MQNKVKVLICGDFVAKEPEKIQVSDQLSKLISDSDISICNFEAPIEAKDVSPEPKSGPTLFQSIYSPSFLERLGFNVIMAANNHMMDYGEDAARKTVDAFQSSQVIGIGRPKDAYACHVKEIQGKRIGFLSFCQYEFGITEGKDDSNNYGVAWINSPDVSDLIRDSKSSCDFLIVLPHAGLEDIDAPLPIWKQNYRKLVDWGADAVIASHPHVPQSWEVYHGKPIFYSLGNFYFDVLGGNDYWNKGLIVELILGEAIDFKVYNTLFGKDGGIKFDSSDEISQHNEELLALISDDKNYSRYIDEECKKRCRVYTYSILRGLGGVSWSNLSLKMILRLMVLSFINNKDKETLLNTLRCETHRWVYERCLIISNKKYGKQ